VRPNRAQGRVHQEPLHLLLLLLSLRLQQLLLLLQMPICCMEDWGLRSGT
jgi:hypothetical protein